LKLQIIYASRYGSTAEISGIIGGYLRLRGAEVQVNNVTENLNIKDFDMTVLGSGIYAHKMLPEMESFITENSEILKNTAVGMFGVAMRTETVHKNGRTFGGELILDSYGLDPVVKGMLHGRMDFAGLTENDRAGLERFYSSIGLSEEEKAKRRELRDEISEDECTDFAEKVLDFFRR